MFLRLASLAPDKPRRLKSRQRHVCRGCGQHPAKFRYRGQVRADRDHTLCFRCYRAERNRQRALDLRGYDGDFRLKAEATQMSGRS